MNKNYDDSDLRSMMDLIIDYITPKECRNKNSLVDNFDCKNCECIEECYFKANDICNSEYARSVNYGGCSSEDEFWEHLFG